MSSDGNGPDIPRQRSDNTSWGQSFEHAHQVDPHALPPLPDSGNEEVFDSSTPASSQNMDAWDDTGSQTGQFEPRSSPFDFLFDFFKEPGRLMPIIVVPLLFAIFTSLLVFLALNLHRSYISPVGFLPTIIVIIAVAVAQGTFVSFSYYSEADLAANPDLDLNANNGLWMLATLGGFSLFFVIGTFALFGPVSALVMFCLFVLLFIVIIRLYSHSVADGYVDIVFAFGRYRRTLYPGPNVLLPWEKHGPSLNVREKQWACPLQKVQLSRDEDVVLRAIISYRLMPQDAHFAVTQTSQWEEKLKELVVSSIQSVATTFTPDDFIAWPQGLHSQPLTYDNAGEEMRWKAIDDKLHELIGEPVANWGVEVNWIHIRDVSLAPHGATIVETDAVFDMPTTIIENPAPPLSVPQPAVVNASAAMVPASQPRAQRASVTAENARLADETTQMVPAPPPQALQDDPPPSSTSELPNEKALIEAYRNVQDGKITDPITIRSIAAKFHLIAQNPQARETVSFDADRAAQILYGWAQKQDPLSATSYNEETKPDRPPGQPDDGNLMAGG